MKDAGGSPGVVFRGGPGAGEDGVQALKGRGVEVNLQRPEGGVQLLPGARAGHRRRHGGLVQQPGQRQFSGLVAELVREVLIAADLVPVLLEGLRSAALGPADAVVLLLERSAEQPAVQRRPWQDPSP